MKTILCFGDSNTHGYNPQKSNQRYGKDIRWTGLLANLLDTQSIIEEGLNGRTTGFEDSIEPYRNGSQQLIPCLMSHSPIDLLIIMLGTNDTKERYHVSAEEIIYSFEELLQKALSYVHWNQQKTEILLVAPVPLQIRENHCEFSSHSVEKSIQLPHLIKELAKQYQVHFFDAATTISSLGSDGIHFSSKNHHDFAHALSQEIKQLLNIEF